MAKVTFQFLLPKYEFPRIHPACIQTTYNLGPTFTLTSMSTFRIPSGKCKAVLFAQKVEERQIFEVSFVRPTSKVRVFSCSFVRNLNIYTDDVFRYDIPAFMAVRLFLFSLSYTLSLIQIYALKCLPLENEGNKENNQIN